MISLASLVLPGVALGVSDGNNTAVFDGSSSAVQRAGALGFGGVEIEVRVEQSSPTSTAEPEKPATARRYVQPHWVDGGYGVEILAPGNWTGNENETRH